MITLRKFTASARLSEETTAYDTQVLFEGKLIGTCRNNGQGGQGMFHRAEGVDAQRVKQANDWAKTQAYTEPDGSLTVIDGKVLYFDGVEDYCDFLADEALSKRQLTRQVKAALKKAILMVDPSKGPGIFEIKRAWDARLEPQLRAKHPQATFLNALPIEQACQAFMEEDLRREREAQAKQRKAPAP